MGCLLVPYEVVLFFFNLCGDVFQLTGGSAYIRRRFLQIASMRSFAWFLERSSAGSCTRMLFSRKVNSENPHLGQQEADSIEKPLEYIFPHFTQLTQYPGKFLQSSGFFVIFSCPIPPITSFINAVYK